MVIRDRGLSCNLQQPHLGLIHLWLDHRCAYGHQNSRHQLNEPKFEGKLEFDLLSIINLALILLGIEILFVDNFYDEFDDS